MRMIETHSHLGGLEHLQIHNPRVWKDVCLLVQIPPSDGKANVVEDIWADWLLDQGWKANSKGNFVKERIGLRVLPADEGSSAYATSLAAYAKDEIDVGIEILPMKCSQSQMNPDAVCYEGELDNVIRNGRVVPTVPLVLVGIDA